MNYLQRKKLAFMKVVNSVKGFVRSIAGIPPLTLPNCVDNESVISYSLYGNSTQDGTPSPDNPVEIESVGVRTKNLFPNDWELGYINITTGENTTGNIANIRTKDYFTFDKNQVYFISSNDLTDTHNLTWYFYDENKTFISRATSKRNRTVSVETNNKQVKIPVNAVYYRLVVNTTDINVKVLLELGTSATDWEPYGYKIPVVARGKNLIDYRNFVSRNQSTLPLTINDDGSLDYTGTYYIKVPLSHLQSGKTYAFRMTYIFDGQLVEVGENLGTCQFRYTDGSYLGARYGVGVQTDPNKELLELHCYFKSGYQQTFTAKIWDIQLEEAYVSTEYEPYKEPITTNIYLDEPLMGIGKASDYVDFENNKVVRMIGNCLLGISARREINHDTLISYYYLVPDKTKVADTTAVEVLSPSLVGIPRNKNITLYNTPAVSSNANNTAVFYYLYRDDVGGDTDALVRAYLQANPITIYYELATPVEENIDLQQLPTFKGTTVYEVVTEVQPSNMEVTYYSSQKGE